jgi:hypothetical protein
VKTPDREGVRQYFQNRSFAFLLTMRVPESAANSRALGHELPVPKEQDGSRMSCGAALLFEGQAILISLLTGHSLENIPIER